MFFWRGWSCWGGGFYLILSPSRGGCCHQGWLELNPPGGTESHLWQGVNDRKTGEVMLSGSFKLKLEAACEKKQQQPNQTKPQTNKEINSEQQKKSRARGRYIKTSEDSEQVSFWSVQCIQVKSCTRKFWTRDIFTSTTDVGMDYYIFRYFSGLYKSTKPYLHLVTPKVMDNCKHGYFWWSFQLKGTSRCSALCKSGCIF